MFYSKKQTKIIRSYNTNRTTHTNTCDEIEIPCYEFGEWANEINEKNMKEFVESMCNVWILRNTSIYFKCDQMERMTGTSIEQHLMPIIVL